jgi:hypothetical protein
VIFYFRITDMALQGRCFVGDVVGKVLAHEVGHLLLPRPGHSSRGIMQANVELASVEQASFTDAQAQAMREALTDAPATSTTPAFAGGGLRGLGGPGRISSARGDRSRRGPVPPSA